MLGELSQVKVHPNGYREMVPALPPRYARAMRKLYRRARSKAWRVNYLVLKDAWLRHAGAMEGCRWRIGEAPMQFPRGFWGGRFGGYEIDLFELHAKIVYRRLASGKAVHPDALFCHPVMREAFIAAGWTFLPVGPCRIKAFDRRGFEFGGGCKAAPVVPPYSEGWIHGEHLRVVR